MSITNLQKRVKDLEIVNPLKNDKLVDLSQLTQEESAIVEEGSRLFECMYSWESLSETDRQKVIEAARIIRRLQIEQGIISETRR